jgi:gamma-glutamyltranspeptidase/glutathione hydrolase
MFTTRPDLVGNFGMVTSTHWLATASGMSVLERGGNAFDAAVAAGLVLQVAEPHLTGPGGEVPILAYRSDEDSVSVINGQGTAPAAATVSRFVELGLDIIPGSGLLPACVPGAFDAWMVLGMRYGRLRLRDLMQYAIHYAETGVPVLAGMHKSLSVVAELFLNEWISSAQIYLPSGAVPAIGSSLCNPDLAATYNRILNAAERAASSREGQFQSARDQFYRGFVAEAIDRFYATVRILDTSGRRHGGLLRANDLAQFEAREEATVFAEYRQYEVHKTNTWGQGPAFLQQLRILESLGVDAGSDLGELVHLVLETAKLALADRDAWYGDPAFSDIPIDALLSREYAAQRASMIGSEASHHLRPGSPDGRDPRLPAIAEVPDSQLDQWSSGEADLGVPHNYTPAQAFQAWYGDTSQVDVVDADGNMVAATPSGGWLQGSPVVPGLGFPVTTRGQMFWLSEGLANSLEPGKRPRTTLSPTFVRCNGDPYLAFGTPGGDQQDQWPLWFFLLHTGRGMSLQQAIDAPAFHTDHLIGSFYPRRTRLGVVRIEDRFPREIIDQLRGRGHLVEVAESWELGRTCVVGRGPDARSLFAAANPRGMHAYAAGR